MMTTGIKSVFTGIGIGLVGLYVSPLNISSNINTFDINCPNY